MHPATLKAFSKITSTSVDGLKDMHGRIPIPTVCTTTAGQQHPDAPQPGPRSSP